MSRKRRNTSSPEPDDSPSSKRRYSGDIHHDSDEEESAEVPRLDEKSGQTGAFPGLGLDSEELFYGPASDGIDYLRMVRSEAKSVPHILTAADRETRPATIEEQTVEGGYYYDGTYTAATRVSTTKADNASYPLAQQYYHRSLLAHFRDVQTILRCAPPLSQVELLHPSQFISFPESSRQVRSQWENHMISADPHPVQLACMDAETVLGLVRFLNEKLDTWLRYPDEKIVSRVSAWVWAILGKCRDRGELASEEIGEIRELAQGAIRLQEQRKAGTKANGNHESGNSFGEDGDERNDGSAAVGEGAKIAKEGIDEILDRTAMIPMMLDMIITVVGEVYGQRDLLESRIKWPVAGIAS